MKILYFSRTGNIKRFVRKLEMNTIQATGDMQMKEPFILIMYTCGIGEVPSEVQQFFTNEYNVQNAYGIICSGNKNWGINYCRAAEIISERYKIPVLQRFELSGNKYDVENFMKMYKEINNE